MSSWSSFTRHPSIDLVHCMQGEWRRARDLTAGTQQLNALTCHLISLPSATRVHVSAHSVPRSQVLFYCHFPDQLLASRSSLVKRVYRYPFDRVEEWTSGLAHRILVNSQFTLETFRATFQRLASMVDDGRVHVLYPSIDFARYRTIDAAEVANLPERKEIALLDELIYGPPSSSRSSTPRVHLLTSINRFERKKNINLAIEAFARFHAEQRQSSTASEDGKSNSSKKKKAASPKQQSASSSSASAATTAVDVRLLICGGYDPVNIENREHYAELWTRCQELGLTPIELKNVTVTDVPTAGADGATKHIELQFGAGSSAESNSTADAAPSSSSGVVYFLRSFTDVQRSYLLSHSRCILYTPAGEHFGIVPVEAMYMRRPVVACKSGGPKESIVDWNHETTRDQATGFLCEPRVDEWTQAIRTLIESEVHTPPSSASLSAELGSRGRRRVLERFHFDTFQADLIRHIRSMNEEDGSKAQ
jgi:alpha-1,3/alpha-1,6-mannosyltransferase